MMWRMAWRSSMRLVSWWPWLICAGALMLVLALMHGGVLKIENGVFVLRVIMPMALAVQCALAFVPAEEPMLEVVAAAPRSVLWLLAERLLMVCAAQAVLGALTVAGLLGLPDVAVMALLGRWCVAALALASLALWITQLGRHGSVGVIVGLLAGFGFWTVGDIMVERWPWLRMLHPFLRPETVSSTTYWLNRIILILGGLALLVAAGWLLRDTERVMGFPRRRFARPQVMHPIKEHSV